MSIEIPTGSATLIGLEARANPFVMINPQVKDNLLTLTSNVTDTLASAAKSLFQTTSVNGINLDARASKKTMERHQYLDVRMVKVPVPEGFNGPYVGYVNLLLSSLSGMDDLVKDVLSPVNDALSLLVAHPERATGTTGDALLKSVNYPENTIKEYTNGVSTFFTLNGTDEFKSFGEVFDRNKDFVTFIEEAIKLSNLYARRPIVDILKHINYLNEVSDLLYIRLKSGQLTEVQNKQADMAAQMLSHASRCVELYGSLCTLIEQLLTYAGTVYRHVTTVLSK